MLGSAQHLGGIITAADGGRERPAILLVESHGFFDGGAQLLEDGQLVVPMTTAVEQTRATADKALVFLGPLDDLDVTYAFFHRFASAIAAFSDRSGSLRARTSYPPF